MHEVFRSPAHDRKRSLGSLAVRWMHHFLLHGPGDIQGTPLHDLPLSDELIALTLDCYALDEDGRRLYDSVFYSRPKGADKSGHAARLGLFEALGPCRFAGWASGGEVYEQFDFKYTYRPGEPMGRRVTYPFLRILATEEGQTGNVYDSIYYNLKEGPLSQAFARKDDVGLTRVYLPGGGEIRPSTASSASKDGGKETWANYDETHLYLLPELHRMYSTVRRNMAKRKDAEPWSFESSTMYEIGRGSVAEKSHEFAQQAKKGAKYAQRFLFDHREGSIEIDLDNEAQIRASLRESYGDAASYMDFDRIIAEIRDPRNELNDSFRFFFNKALAIGSQAFSPTAWQACIKPDYVVARKSLIVLGFDGARHRDSTALVATEVATGYQWPLGIWQRPPSLSWDAEWSVPEDEVDAVVAEAFRTFEVWRMYCDPPYWEATIAAWAGRYGEKVVIEWYTNRYRQMAFALRAYANAMADGDVSHNGHSVLAEHVANARRVPLSFHDDEGKPLWIIAKDGPQSPRKIDAAMAGCLSWEARLDAVAAGVSTTSAAPRVRWIA